MAVSSELPLAAESIQSALWAEGMQPVERQLLAGEEFPRDLPDKYESILQDACRRATPRAFALIAITVMAILVACCLVYSLPKLAPSVWASPSSSSPLSH
jgi:hypothetical protein